MKAKHVIATLSLSIALGVGSFVGVSYANKDLKQANADSTRTIYLDVSGVSFWHNDGALAYGHFYSTTDSYSSWPGLAMSLVSGETDVYSVEVNSAATQVIFNRVNPSDHSVWNRTSKSDGTSINIPSDKDCFVLEDITQTGYDNGNDTGSWTNYTPSAEPVYSVFCHGATVDLTLDEENKPEGVLHQYSASVQYAARGDLLKFYKNGAEITEDIGVDYVDGAPAANNNIYGDATNGFRIYHTFNYLGYTKVYLKTYADGGMSLWGQGYGENSFYSVIKTSSGTTNVTLSLDEDFVADETYIEQYKTSAAVDIEALGGIDWSTSNDVDNDGGISERLNYEGGENNAKAAFQGTAWTVYNDCHEVIYLKVKKTDLTLWLYIGGRVHSYVATVTRAGEEPIAIPLTESGDEYVAHDVDLLAGDVISYSIDGVTQTLASKPIGNNNMKSDLSVLADVEGADIYFSKGSEPTVWVSGLGDVGGFSILRNGHEFILGNYNSENEYMTTLVEFAVDDTLQIIDCSSSSSLPVVFNANYINEYSEGTWEIDDGVATCKKAATLRVYIQLAPGNDGLYFAYATQEQKDALAFVEAFKTALATACGGSDKAGAVATAWAGQVTAYAALSEGAKDEVGLGGYSSFNEIQEFAERYIWFLQEYPSLTNFLDWTIPARASSHLFVVSNNYTFMIVAISAFVAISAVGVYFIIKKKKHN